MAETSEAWTMHAFTNLTDTGQENQVEAFAALFASDAVGYDT